MFVVTPREPRTYLYNYAKSVYEYYARLTCYGVHLNYYGGQSLKGSYDYDQAFLSCNNVGSPLPDPFPSNYYERAVASVRFKTNSPTDSQYLAVFDLTCYGKIGIYLNGNLVREEDCNGYETIIVTVDCPGPNIWDTLYVVPAYSAYIKGVDCYVI